MNKTLNKILEEGFTKSNKTCGHYDIYEKKNERIIYDSYNNKVVTRYDLQEINKGEVGGDFSTIDFEV